MEKHYFQINEINFMPLRFLKSRITCFSTGLFVVIFSLTLGCSSGVDIPQEVLSYEGSIPKNIDYNIHVKPILSDKCFKCHGPDKNKIEAGLQLATSEGATMKLESGEKAIVPGNLGKSELIYRILSTDPEEVMPTPESHLSLSDEDKAVLIKWIEQGAEYKEHWSLTKIEKPEVPKVGKSIWARWNLTSDEETKWVKNEIDHFTLAKMKEKGLKPNPEANKTTLLRRVYMDLTGLPPTPEKVDSFLKDTRSDAYEKVVEQLIQSQHYGEQQATSWLDLARYADSHGYQDDIFRNAFPYRDWVIKSFNENLPFDKFITWQLAGDLLPNPSQDMLVATSFNRQHAQTVEGGVVPEEYRTEYVADRTNTFGKAFLALTMECARCHDHKYDPISQKDYFSLFAFFNQNKENGQAPYKGEASPTVMITDKEVKQVVQMIQANLKDVEQNFKPEQYTEIFNQWKTQNKPSNSLEKGLLVYLPMDNKNPSVKNTNKTQLQYKAEFNGDPVLRPITVPGKIGNALNFTGDAGINIYLDGLDKINGKFQAPDKRFQKGLNFENNQAFSVNLWLKPMKESTSGVIFQRSNYDYEGYRGFSVYLNPDKTLTALISHTWPANCIELKTTKKISLKNWNNLTLTYDGSAKAKGVSLFIDGKYDSSLIVTNNLKKSILHDSKGENMIFGLFEIGSDRGRKMISECAIDEFRIYNRRISTLEVRSLAEMKDAVSEILSIPEKKSSPVNNKLLLEHYILAVDTGYMRAMAKYSSLRSKEVEILTKVPEVMIMEDLPRDQLRKTFVLNRGVYDAPGEEVVAETPFKLGSLQKGVPRNRLSLSKWLLNENNPLFTRVMANRFWLMYFGNGLVKSQEDFGNQGDMPSHPELLDWLAITLREDNWNVKKFIKRIVLSATYRQSSLATPENIEIDPGNKWLARGPSYRFAAEQVRDNALAASNLLVREIGGPSVYPYQPSGIWEAMATRSITSYTQQHGDSLYRRSMYTIWKRTSPPPMMINFDSPDRSNCSVRRQNTATPLQALVTLNDPQFVEAARVLAQKTMKITTDHKQRIEHMFLAAISRRPRANELELMDQLFRSELKGFITNKNRAASLAHIGEYPMDSSLDDSYVAAYTIVANTILNYDEAIIKR
jgi:hypothetical protein